MGEKEIGDQVLVIGDQLLLVIGDANLVIWNNSEYNC